MHQDMERHFALYPKTYGMRRPDACIDHRRVRNQMTFHLAGRVEEVLAFALEEAVSPVLASAA